MAFAAPGDVCRGASNQDLTSSAASFRTEIDDMVGGLNNVEIVLDDDDGMAGIDQTVQAVEEFLSIGEMEARGRFVEDVDDVASALQFAQQRGQLNALGLTSGERRR